MSGLPLSERFPPATEEAWRARAGAATLHHTSPGARASRPQAQAWHVVQRVDHPDPSQANRQALDGLEHGATALAIVTADSTAARGFGLVCGDEALGRALAGVALHAIGLRIDGGLAAAESMVRLIRGEAVNPALLDFAFGINPIGGGPSPSLETLAEWSAEFRGPFFEADGRPWHERGASEALELTAVLAAAAAYLRMLEWMPAQKLGQAVGVTLTAGRDMFPALAKFRAMRRLWARLLEASGLPSAPLELHAETSFPMMAALDPHTNILRTAAAAMGAGLGGADSITVLAFSIAQGLPDAFARRVARHQQAVLIEESQLWRIADPALGAGYVEHLTAGLCEQAWDLFREIERRGGMAGQPAQDWLKLRIAAEPADVAPVIGVTAYRLSAEHAAAVEAVP
jgi:methylmalonyl-CoA mutase